LCLPAQEAEAFNPLLRSFERAVRDYHRHVQGESESSRCADGGVHECVFLGGGAAEGIGETSKPIYKAVATFPDYHRHPGPG
jgi:hypothetical protein